MLNMARMRREFCCSAGSFTLRGIVAKWILLPPWGSAQSSALPGLVHPMPHRHSCRRPLPHRAVASSADTLGYSRNIMDTFPPTGRTTVRRLPQRGVYDKARVYAILDEGFICHVGFAIGGQWFPKVGVWWHGAWNCHQYHAMTEFFADFGVYDVKLTVPQYEVV